MARRFTIWEAEQMLPQVRDWMREAVALKAQFDQAQHTLDAFTQRIMLMGGMVVDRRDAVEARKRRQSAGEQLHALLESIQETGCLVKDLDTGLVDFPTLFRGEEVYLCWKLDEPAIGFWHGVRDGFAGRQPIDQDFVDHHQGDPAN
jgi:hypothetical protein